MSIAPSSLPPTLPGTSSIANGIALTRDPLGFFTRLSREAGDFAHYMLSDGIMYFVNDPALVRTILIKHEEDFEKWAFNESFRRIFGTGLIGSHGDLHDRVRKVSNPPLQPGRISAMAETIVRLVEQRQQSWTEGEINLSREMTLLTLDVVGQALFFLSLGERCSEMCDAISALLRLSTRIGAAPDETEAFHQANNTVSRIADEIIEEGKDKGEDDSLLSILIASERAGIVSAAQLREEVRTFLLAGHVTTAQSLACAFWLMARHPEVREKLEAEADQIPRDRSLNFEDIPRLRFCEMVMLETLRIYPPVWVFGREALRQVELQGTVIRVGEKLVICPWLLHRNPAVFPEPEAFRPKRWENDARSHLPRGTYLPFSTGARNCLGEHFAMMESTLVLASLARNWRFDELPGRPDPGWSAHLLYWPRRGIHLHATRRRPHDLSK